MRGELLSYNWPRSRTSNQMQLRHPGVACPVATGDAPISAFANIYLPIYCKLQMYGLSKKVNNHTKIPISGLIS